MLYVMRNESSIVKKLVAGNFYVLYEKFMFNLYNIKWAIAIVLSTIVKENKTIRFKKVLKRHYNEGNYQFVENRWNHQISYILFCFRPQNLKIQKW